MPPIIGRPTDLGYSVSFGNVAEELRGVGRVGNSERLVYQPGGVTAAERVGPLSDGVCTEVRRV